MDTRRFEFLASLHHRGNAMSMDSEGEATIRLAADAQQISEVLRLAAFGRGKRLRVTVEVDDQS